MNRRDRRGGGSWASWSLSILLHAGIVAVLAGVWFWPQSARPPERLAIEGSVVTAAQLAGQAVAEPVPLEPAPAPPPEPEPLPEELPPPEPDPAVLQAEAERVAEERRIALEQEAAERKAREAAAREQSERERREKEKAERERQARQRAEREQAERERREADLAAQLAAERQRDAVRGSEQANQYKALLTARIMRAWIKPPSARVGLVCEVTVTQVPGGAVTGVRFGRCNGDDAVRQSIEAAVFRASPLPPPPDAALFEREFGVRFIPEE